MVLGGWSNWVGYYDVVVVVYFVGVVVNDEVVCGREVDVVNSFVEVFELFDCFVGGYKFDVFFVGYYSVVFKCCNVVGII